METDLVSSQGMIKNAVSPHTCGSCSLWKHPSEFYATCLVFSKAHWKQTIIRKQAPFWRNVPSMKIEIDMTARTLATEGSNCAAYIELPKTEP